MEISKSKSLYEKSSQYVPAGVHSPVRAFRSVGGSPIFFDRGEGANLYDVDNNKYLDFCMSWGALLIGHAHPNVTKALQERIHKGTHFGTPTELDVELSQLILKQLPFYDKIRFVNSGTEAVMTAVRLARGYTGKNKIVKVDGSYHGHVDSLLVSAGSGLMTQGEASSLGVTPGTIQDTITIGCNSYKDVDEVFIKYKDQIAAIIIEPIMANAGLFTPDKKWIRYLREKTQENKSLLIFDEVITGFRVGLQGAVGFFDVKPDIGTYGKIIGGGLPVGAVCASNEIMNYLAPIGKVYQAGTLSGNPLCMAAGIATMTTAIQSNVYSYVENELGPYLDAKISELKATTKNPFYYKRVGAIFWICPNISKDPQNYHDITSDQIEAYKKVFHKLISQGIYLAPSVYEVSFLSLAHKKDDIDLFVNALRNS
jgi:glutamate-1-semialdehyde 2,1-aminomutase